MHESLIITIIAQDRPNLVHQVSAVIRAHDGNWSESRMAHLAGHFTGILLAQVPKGQTDALRSALDAMSADGIMVSVVSSTSAPKTERLPLEIEMMCNDRPGIVQDVFTILGQHKINVEELSTAISHAPMSGHMLFTGKAKLSAPQGTDLSALRDSLESLSQDLMLELRILHQLQT